MDQDLEARLNSLEKRLRDCEEPGTLYYCRPGSEDHEKLADFLNDAYIQLQELKQVVAEHLNATSSHTSNS